jgi:DNA-binding CsgD family transcriptional regulator
MGRESAGVGAHRPLLDLRACSAGPVGAAGTVGLAALVAVLAVGLAAVGALGAAGDRPDPGGGALAVGLAAHLHHHLGAEDRVVLGAADPLGQLHQLLAGRRQQRLLAAGAVPRDYLGRLVEAFEQAGLPIRPPVGRGGVVVAGLVEPLTARELEVLQLLAAGAPNRAIAERLVVTQETVKKHLSHLFDKLGAVNRTQAVARARELGLLS